jgi:hypothetical protein
MLDTVLQWNMRLLKAPKPEAKRAGLGALEAMVDEHSPGILALQEAPLDFLSQRFLRPRYRLIEGPKGLLTGFLESRWQVIAHHHDVNGRALVAKVDSGSGRLRLWFWNVHLPVLWKDLAARRTFVQSDFRDALSGVRKRGPGRSELLVGDFNLPPHDDGMVRRSGLYANRALRWVESKGFPHETRNRPLFNPTWTLFGALDAPYGTYLTPRYPDEEGPWFVLDQALMSADLALPGEPQIRILQDTDRKQSKVSDHLALLIAFRAR